MAVNLLYWKVCLAAELAIHLFVVISFLKFTAITIINFFLGNFLKAIAGQMKTCIARIAVQDLIRLIIEATKADFTISFEYFLVRSIIAFGWFQ
jgi:hypothetical protein